MIYFYVQCVVHHTVRTYVCPLIPLRVYVGHWWESVSNFGRISFVRYHTWCGASRNSECKRNENCRGCVTWVPNITTGFKEKQFKSSWLTFFFLCKEKIIVSCSRIFVYSVRGEPGIVQASFINRECCASLCDDNFSSIYRWTKFGMR